MPKTLDNGNMHTALKQWTDLNPLRKYRTQGRITLSGASAILRVSIGTVCLWETGSRRPNAEKFESIAALIGVQACVKSRCDRTVSRTAGENLATQWTTWEKKAPLVQPAA